MGRTSPPVEKWRRVPPTVVTSHQATENQTLLVSEPPTECRHSNTRVKDTVLENPICPKQGQSYVLPTWLVRCQILDIC